MYLVACVFKGCAVKCDYSVYFFMGAIAVYLWCCLTLFCAF